MFHNFFRPYCLKLNIQLSTHHFPTTILIYGHGQHMSPMEYHDIFEYRLLIPLFTLEETCPVCRKECLDSFGEHTVHYNELSVFKYRYDLVRDVLFDIVGMLRFLPRNRHM